MGCFKAGCCSGGVWDGGVSYPAGSGAYAIQLNDYLIGPWAATSLPVVPIPLIEACILVLLSISGLFLRRRSGAPFVFCVLGYAAWRFLADFWRADSQVIFGSGFTLAQGISMGVVLSILLILIRGKGGHQAPQDPVQVNPGILQWVRLVGLGLIVLTLATCVSQAQVRDPGYIEDDKINVHGQKLIRTTSEPSPTYSGGAYKCIMVCTRCELMYYSNTLDVKRARCPFCQEGKKGEPPPLESETLPTGGSWVNRDCESGCRCLLLLAEVGASYGMTEGQVLQEYGEMAGVLDVDVICGKSRIAHATMTGTFEVIEAPADGPLVAKGFAETLTVSWKGRSVTGSGDVEIRVSLDRQVTLVGSTLPVEVLSALKAMEPLVSDSFKVDVDIEKSGPLGSAIRRDLKDLSGDPRCYGTFIVEGEHGSFEMDLSSLHGEVGRWCRRTPTECGTGAAMCRRRTARCVGVTRRRPALRRYAPLGSTPD